MRGQVMSLEDPQASAGAAKCILMGCCSVISIAPFICTRLFDQSYWLAEIAVSLAAATPDTASDDIQLPWTLPWPASVGLSVIHRATKYP